MKYIIALLAIANLCILGGIFYYADQICNH